MTIPQSCSFAIIQRVCVLGFTLFIAACSTVEKAVDPLLFWRDSGPALLTVNISAEDNINPNVDEKPSPIELRVYQLSDSEAFQQAEFLPLYEDEQGVLKATLLNTRQLQSVLPGETRKEVFPFNAETKFIGVIAAFADYREANNKAIYAVEEAASNTINITLDGVNMTMTGEKG
ncbi:type VI secretion system lipoprotein TssJ [Thaumasiovibrio subtropicus]|uniref:type VI secretion system lipoprotein TssJ n=1 Tax=Thaumasiovibrio subtropicus TaxID=1891207 RepID=UPI000B3640E9|nr:type VI secretion system lipoprotein TssJ [Thaumasiovibrio subtropicus]